MAFHFAWRLEFMAEKEVFKFFLDADALPEDGLLATFSFYRLTGSLSWMDLRC